MATNNYILSLRDENTNLKAQIRNSEDMLTDLLAYLASDKFTGTENNFVNAREMFNRVMEIRSSFNC